jgi:hypothetical protein
MSRDLKTFCLRLAALGAAACSSAYAVRSAPEEGALIAGSQPLARSPYDVELIGADGRALATYENGDRFYILGQAGERYSIRVNNPTPRRVEALISVDGLDVIDGETADFVKKRGYVVPAHGELVVDGFRMSTTQVASFRFSSVAESYAERKGKGRNVGVIGVAIFEEKEQPQLIPPQQEISRNDDLDARFGGEGKAEEAEARDSSAPTGGAAGSSHATAAPGADPAAPAPSTAPAEKSGATGGQPADRTARTESDRSRAGDELCCGPAPKKSRPGLGTEWGEERFSAVDFTTFERANKSVPTAMAELRYNDAEGLRALGILLQPSPDSDELHERESADPFPGARGFASPPQ